MRERGLPQVPAWTELHEVLANVPGGVQFFERQPRRFAAPVPAHALRPVPQAGRRVIHAGVGSRARVGQSSVVGVLGWLAQVLPDAVDLDDTPANRVAVRLGDAQELFGFGTSAAVRVVAYADGETHAKGAPTEQGKVIQPVNGAWPHHSRAEWTNAERDAMSLMRWKSGMTDKAIAQVVGVESVHRISQQIGSKTANKRRDWKGGPGGWQLPEEAQKLIASTGCHRLE